MLHKVHYAYKVWQERQEGAATEADGHRDTAQRGVLPSLAGGDWPGWRDLYCDGRFGPPPLQQDVITEVSHGR
jgi:hypothetical protein